MGKKSKHRGRGGASAAPALVKSHNLGDKPFLQVSPRELVEIARAGLLAKSQGEVVEDVRQNWRRYSAAGVRSPGELSLMQSAERGRLMDQSWGRDPRRPQGWFSDPLSLQWAMGWKERIAPVTSDVLNGLEAQVPYIRIIINHRQLDVSKWAYPYRPGTRSLGYRIQHKDQHLRPMNAAEQQTARWIEEFLFHGGVPGYRNPKAPLGVERDILPDYAKKWTRDTLLLDQQATQFVYDNSGYLFEFYIMDGGTMRFAVNEAELSQNATDPQMGAYQQVGFPLPQGPARFRGAFDDKEFDLLSPDGSPTSYVQVIQSNIRAVFSARQMSWLVRNPRSNIYIGRYGFPESEQGILLITTMLFRDQHRRKYYSQGSLPKGILAEEGGEYDERRIQGFRRHWASQLQGVDNAWRTPYFHTSGRFNWIPLTGNERDMEGAAFDEFQKQVFFALYLTDTARVSLAPTRVATPFGTGAADAAKDEVQQDRGAAMLYEAWQRHLNDIVARIHPQYEVVLHGIEEPTAREKELLEAKEKELLTMNERREKLGKPPVVGGDWIMTSEYIQARAQQNVLKMAEAQMQQGTPAGLPTPPSEPPPTIEAPDAGMLSAGSTGASDAP